MKTIECSTCGKAFTIRPHILARRIRDSVTGKVFCSRDCSNRSARNRGVPLSLRERLLEGMIVDEITECWIWQNITRKRKPGKPVYGSLSVNGRDTRAHRLSYEVFKGEIPPGLFVLHSCDVPACINPDHLHLGTAADNAREAKERLQVNRGERNPNAKLTNVQVVEIKRALRDGQSHEVLASEFKVTTASISQIALGRTWAHIL